MVPVVIHALRTGAMWVHGRHWLFRAFASGVPEGASIRGLVFGALLCDGPRQPLGPLGGEGRRCHKGPMGQLLSVQGPCRADRVPLAVTDALRLEENDEFSHARRGLHGYGGVQDGDAGCFV